jgi:hypothetical protein
MSELQAFSKATNPQMQMEDRSGSLIENNNVNNDESSMQNVNTFHSNRSLYHRLPKLSLPVFIGDILEWKSFLDAFDSSIHQNPVFIGDILEWKSFLDAFDSSVHQNPNLMEVQNFNYLKTRLEGSAAQIIQ